MNTELFQRKKSLADSIPPDFQRARVFEESDRKIINFIAAKAELERESLAKKSSLPRPDSVRKEEQASFAAESAIAIFLIASVLLCLLCEILWGM